MGSALKTVLIVGAGASCEVGLPAGPKLKTYIAAKLGYDTDDYGRLTGGDNWIREQLRVRHNNELQQYARACATISNGVALNSSIDDFIDAHRNDPRIALCGKLAIARAILEAEHDSTLRVPEGNVNNTINFAALEESAWHVKLFRWLSRGVQREDRARIFDGLKVICFNYDRCLEHFLTHAIRAHYDVEWTEARDLAATLEIHHPYGTVGPYFGNQAVAFGATPTAATYELTLKTLRTYSEQVHESQSLHAMRAAVAEADVLIFLGMAFHVNNMALLSSGLDPHGTKRTFFTRFGISNEDLPNVQQRLIRSKLVPTHPFEAQYFSYADKCQDLWDKYQLALSDIRAVGLH